MAPVSLPSSCQQRDTEVGLVSDNYPPSTILARKRASVHIIEESWAFLSTSSGVSPINEREGQNSHNKNLYKGGIKSSNNNITDSAPTPSTLRLSPLRPTDTDIDPAVTGATAYEDLPDQELLKTLAAFLRGDSSPSDKKGNRPSAAAATSRSNQDKDESEMSDLVVTVRDFAYPKTHPYHTGNYPPEPKYEESDIEEDEEEDYTEVTAADSSIPGAADDEQDRTEGYARGLYDFDAENSSELSFKEGEFVWIHCRQFPGWFLGEKDGAQGLVPENYVQLV
ncbi:HOG (high osmolarity glycerol) pathway protein [Linnemannia gamsii]|uniref:HOG (High osmolarity glycerol) pathway protein n=1 Tax=Linnemannia gamsii TaxID=64522 RepID=A0A9P6QWL1_9FUNG|nr:HOG (high osmolarity glycerol) pathway protein [Linnemannia gamsii]